MMTNGDGPYKKILVLGAGELGMAILEGFVAQRATRPDLEVSVLLRATSASARNPRQEMLDRWRVKVVVGDLAALSIKELAELFQPFDAVIGCSGFAGGPGTQVKITQAVLLAGVRRYIPWQFGVDYETIGYGSGQDAWDEQLDVRRILEVQNRTNWLIVSTGMFTSYLFEPGFGVVDFDAHKICALGDWDYRVTVTTPEDIGALTAEIFFAQPAFENTVVFIAGDTLSYRDLHALLERSQGTEFSGHLANREALLAHVERNPDDTAGKYRLAFARPDGVAWDTSRTFNAERGLRTRTAEEWLAMHRPRKLGDGAQLGARA